MTIASLSTWVKSNDRGNYKELCLVIKYMRKTAE